jgi:hypothetical protein
MILTGNPDGPRNHGYVFEVPSPGQAAASARPIVGMGRMKHEAVAVDPVTGFVYLTEDNGPSGFYRFRPSAAEGGLGTLERGGVLEMLRLRDRPGADLGAPRAGDLHPVEWVPIRDPDADAERNEAEPSGGPVTLGLGRSGPCRQGQALGGASFRRLEGCFAHDGLIYFTDTTGGQARRGALWALAPAAAADEPDLLRSVFVSSSEYEADNIDNLCVSPRGGIVLCEDGGGIREEGRLVHGTRIVGLGADGAGAFALAENNLLIGAVPSREWIAPGDYRGSEFAGACFSPGGDRLFVNVQTPGVTFEIRGPWERGVL